MILSKDLDQIHQLGFWISMNWCEDFFIYYGTKEREFVSCILLCNYVDNIKYSYDDMVLVCCEFFNRWYTKNKDSITRCYSEQSEDSFIRLDDICLGNITRTVDREILITDIISECRDS